MKSAQLNPDEMLKTMAAEAAKQETHIRSAVRNLMLAAIQSRDQGLAQIDTMIKPIIEGVSKALGGNLKSDQVIPEVIAGIDDALLKVVQANDLALNKLTEGGATFEDSSIKKALTQLEKLENDFRQGVKKAADPASAPLRQQWAAAIDKIPQNKTEAGEQVLRTLEAQAKQAEDVAGAARETGLKIAHAAMQNYATLVSGILIGMSEAIGNRNSQGSK
jgi:hypothetical protein